MKRRRFVGSAAGGMAGILAAQAAPAVAQGLPEVRWRLASSFPKGLDTIFAIGEQVSRRVASLTGNRFQIQVFAAGEIVPGLQVAAPCRTPPCRWGTRPRTTTWARIPPSPSAAPCPSG